MRRNVGSFQIPAGSLTVFFVSAILITLAVYDRLIMPFWMKWKGKEGKHTNLLFIHHALRKDMVLPSISEKHVHYMLNIKKLGNFLISAPKCPPAYI